MWRFRQRMSASAIGKLLIAVPKPIGSPDVKVYLAGLARPGSRGDPESKCDACHPLTKHQSREELIGPFKDPLLVLCKEDASSLSSIREWCRFVSHAIRSPWFGLIAALITTGITTQASFLDRFLLH